MALEDELRERIERYERSDIVCGTIGDDLLAVGELVVVHKDTILAALTERKAPVEFEGLVKRCPILKGIGKIDGDGWKDTTKIGQVVFAWNRELPAPYSQGQYPRVGCEVWSASTKQYDFSPAEPAEVEALFQSQATEIATLKQQLAEREEALRPFATYASNNGFCLEGLEIPDSEEVGRGSLTVGDFRRAARALTRTDGGDQ